MRGVLLCLLMVSGCALETEPPVGPRIALAADFEGFQSWRRVALPEHSITEGHLSSEERYLYIDREAPELPEAFPTGTIVVKTIEIGPPEEWEIHAMVKRGDGYNAHGSVGWEFFDLRFDARERLSIAWRGLGDEATAYIDPTGQVRACSECHDLVPDRDFIFRRELLFEAE